MSKIGVITGDIIDSSAILDAGLRKELLETINKTVNKIEKNSIFGKINFDLYRGDSFQIEVYDTPKTLDIALVFRSALIANSAKELRWDARIGIGIGKGQFLAKRVMESDGEAFHFAGKAFDNLNKDQKMYILTSDSDFNEELEITTAFVNDIIDNWTPTQAQLFYLMHIESLNQKETAAKRRITPQAVSKIYAAGKISLIENWVHRFESKTKNILTNKTQTP